MTATQIKLPRRLAQVYDLYVAKAHTPDEVAKQLGISRNAVYQHIVKLRERGLVEEAPRTAKNGVSGTPALEDLSMQYKRSLEQRLVQIEEEGTKLEDQLKALHDERKQVEDALARVSSP